MGWHDWKGVLNNTNLLVAKRPGNLSLPAEVEEKAVILDNDVMDISSTWIRQNMHSRDMVDDYMDKDLLEYIYEKELYL
jgi:nicotinic acid mononucleotide adenylyltransferase